MSIDANKDGEYIIQRWKEALLNKDQCRSALTRAECEVSNSAEALKNWLVPKDFKLGEKFCVAYQKEFIQIEILEGNNCQISIRPRSK